ncbi:MAG: hypothetical protein JNM17_09775 [Archangium sp.]|nr:hypothetical protein [Archangium sp.]
MRCPWLPITTLGFLAVACGPRRVEVRTEVVDLAGARAVLRLDGEAVCEAEPRFLIDDVSSVNSVLRAFVRAFPSSGPAEWTNVELELLTSSLERLPRVIATQRALLDGLSRCDFASGGAWPELTQRARAVLDEGQAKLDAIPEGLLAAKRARALSAWRRDLQANAEAARRGCTPRNRATVYVAWREAGRTTWRFCDGTQATSERGERPRVETALTKRPLPARVYLDALARFPADALQSAPGEAEELSAW